MNRRTFVCAAGGVAVGMTVLAGCTDGGGGDEGTEQTTETTVEETTTETTTSETGTASPTAADGEYTVAGGPDADEFEVLMRGPPGSDTNYFDPRIVQVAPGATVTWEISAGAHTATAYHPDNDKPRRVPEGTSGWDSGVLTEQGATFEHTFDAEGVYDYYCAPHESLGMVGTIIVGQPSPEGQPALEAPQDSLPEGARSELERLNGVVEEALSGGG